MSDRGGIWRRIGCALTIILTTFTSWADDPLWTVDGPWIGGASCAAGNFHRLFATAQEAARHTCWSGSVCIPQYGPATGFTEHGYTTGVYYFGSPNLYGPVYRFHCNDGAYAPSVNPGYNELSVGMAFSLTPSRPAPVDPPDAAPGKPGKCDGLRGNPVDTATCDKLQVETDYVGTELFPLRFDRYFRSRQSYQDTTFGTHWRHTYSRRVAEQTPGGRIVNVIRPDGRAITYRLNNGAWTPDADVAETLVKGSDSWVFTDRNGDVETYSTNGMLVQISSRSGATHMLMYSDNATPSSVAPGGVRKIVEG